jgi:hypothetical protein
MSTNSEIISPTAPTTAQLIAAFADALAPFAGPTGVAANAVMHAGLTFLSNLQAQRSANSGAFTMVDLETAAGKATTDLAQLAADIDRMEAAKVQVVAP